MRFQCENSRPSHIVEGAYKPPPPPPPVQEGFSFVLKIWYRGNLIITRSLGFYVAIYNETPIIINHVIFSTYLHLPNYKYKFHKNSFHYLSKLRFYTILMCLSNFTQ